MLILSHGPSFYISLSVGLPNYDGVVSSWAIASCTISLHPILAEKIKLSFKKISEICVPDIFFRN